MIIVHQIDMYIVPLAFLHNCHEMIFFLQFYASTISKTKDLSNEHPLVDYTPPSLLTLLYTDLGILTPSAVSDELIKLYLWSCLIVYFHIIHNKLSWNNVIAIMNLNNWYGPSASAWNMWPSGIPTIYTWHIFQTNRNTIRISILSWRFWKFKSELLP